MKRFLVNALYFSRAERLGALALLLVGAAAIIVPEISLRLQADAPTDFSAFQADIAQFRAGLDQVSELNAALFAFDPNEASYEDLVRLGLSEKIARTICRYREKGGRFRNVDDFRKIWGMPEALFTRLAPYIRLRTAQKVDFQENKRETPASVVLFAFDPNEASEADWKRLGVPARIAGNIIRYREKGGHFRKKEDLLKIYGFSDDDYARLEPYVAFAETTAPRPMTYGSGAGSNRHFESRPSVSIDINEAAAEDWQKLPGIGAARAQRIVGFRDKLGGFISVEQVADTRGLPDSIFQKIKSLLHFGAPVYHPISLNTATVEELCAHPYFSDKQARLIVAYREQHGPFSSVDALANIAAFRDAAWLAKVKPYLYTAPKIE